MINYSETFNSLYIKRFHYPLQTKPTTSKVQPLDEVLQTVQVKSMFTSQVDWTQ